MSVIDVLLHVNALTAAHLDEWIDELQRQPGDATTPPLIAIPDTYLRQADTFVDGTIVLDALLNGFCVAAP